MGSSDTNILNSIQFGGDPLKTYRKTTLGKVFINVWNSFENKPEGLILEGKPGSDDSIYSVWNEREMAFFEAKNKRLIETDHIIEFKPEKQKKSTKPIGTYSDLDLEEILAQKYFAFKKFVDELESVPTLFRLVELAEKLEKPSKTVEMLKARLSEVQAAGIPNIGSGSSEE